MKINHIFAILTFIFFGLWFFCFCGVASGSPTPSMMGFYGNATQVCGVLCIITKIIGDIARKKL